MQPKQRENYTSRLCIAVAATTVAELSSKVRAARKYSPGFIELRIDHLKESLTSRDRREAVSCLFDGREILTLRSKAQGGKFWGKEALRTEIVKDFVEEHSPRFVDVEHSTLAQNEDLRSVLRRAKGTTDVIVSTHFFNRTPPHSELESIASHAPDFVYATKISCFAKTFSDNFNLLSLYETRRNAKLIAFCMGPLGVFTRIACITLGSPFTYASLPNEQIAPGQLDAQTMSGLLAKI